MGITSTTMPEHLYYYISEDCLRIDTCVDLVLKNVAYTKAMRAYIDLDPCNFLLTVSFEKWTETFILINYQWGKCRTRNSIHHYAPN